MCAFKKGAFESLLSIRPKAVRYNTFGCMNPGSGILDGIVHHILVLVSVFSVLEVYEMPIFRPNEYFWKHHQKEGEEKWQTYARVIRDIISEGGNIPIAKHEDGSDCDLKEKQEYKELLWPKKNKTPKKED